VFKPLEIKRFLRRHRMDRWGLAGARPILARPCGCRARPGWYGRAAPDGAGTGAAGRGSNPRPLARLSALPREPL